MKKLISIMLIIATMFTFAACSTNTNNPTDTQKPSNSETPIIKVYPETMEGHVAEKYGEGWVRGEAFEHESIGTRVPFTKGDVTIWVLSKKDLVEIHGFPEDWFEGYFGDNGYAALNADYIQQYFAKALPKLSTDKVSVLAELPYLGYPSTLDPSKSWEENWAAHDKVVVPIVRIFMDLEPAEGQEVASLSEEDYNAIDAAYAALGYGLQVYVYDTPGDILNNPEELENLYCNPGDRLIRTLFIRMAD